MENKNIFSIEFSIPRDLELVEGFSVHNQNEDFQITLSILKRKLKILGINTEQTNALFVNGEDRFGDNVETRLKAEFVFNKNLINQGWELFSNEEQVKWITNLEDMFIKNAIILLNQVIETHQYVNDKYYIFPIEEINIYNFMLTTPIKIGYGGNQFAGGYFTNDYRRMEEIINENSRRVSEFINKKEKFFEPLRIMKYSVEFMNMGLLRIAITESQSSIEHLLTKKYFEITKKEFPKKISKKRETDFNFIEKLQEFSKVQEYFKYDNLGDNDKNILNEAKNKRNEIIHGKEVLLTKEDCKKYLEIYKKIFNAIYLIA